MHTSPGHASPPLWRHARPHFTTHGRWRVLLHKSRMQFPHCTNRHELKNRRISTIRSQIPTCAHGNCMRNYGTPGGTGGTAGMGGTGWARVVARRRQLDTRTAPRQHNTPPPRTALCHCRYKTRPAHPSSPHARYKTRPARPKWSFLACFSHAWRTFYRLRQQETTQGELCTVFTANEPRRANFIPHARQRWG